MGKEICISYFYGGAAGAAAGVGHPSGFGDAEPVLVRPGWTAVFDFLTNGCLNCGIL